MPKRKHLIELLAALRILQGKNIPYVDKGICFNLHSCFNIKYAVLGSVMNEASYSWKYFSGLNLYPVSHSRESPILAFEYSTNLWTGEYGRRRYELVDRMIDVCIKHIDSTESKLSVINK